MLKAKAGGRRTAVGEDEVYDTADHVAKLREMNVVPHVAQFNGSTAPPPGPRRRPHHASPGGRNVAILPTDDRLHFAGGKQHGTMRKTKHQGIARVAADFMLDLIGYNSAILSMAIMPPGLPAEKRSSPRDPPRLPEPAPGVVD